MIWLVLSSIHAIHDFLLLCISQQTVEPTLYDDDEYNPVDKVMDDDEKYDWNVDYDSLEPSDLAKLIRLLQERGPRAYDDDEYY